MVGPHRFGDDDELSALSFESTLFVILPSSEPTHCSHRVVKAGFTTSTFDVFLLSIVVQGFTLAHRQRLGPSYGDPA